MATRIPTAPAEVSVALARLDEQIRELGGLIKHTNMTSIDARVGHEGRLNYSKSVLDMIGEMIALHEIAHDTAYDHRRLYYRGHMVQWQGIQLQVEFSRRNLRAYLGLPE
jgi:hypothetical protein